MTRPFRSWRRACRCAGCAASRSRRCCSRPRGCRPRTGCPRDRLDGNPLRHRLLLEIHTLDRVVVVGHHPLPRRRPRARTDLPPRRSARRPPHSSRRYARDAHRVDRDPDLGADRRSETRVAADLDLRDDGRIVVLRWSCCGLLLVTAATCKDDDQRSHGSSAKYYQAAVKVLPSGRNVNPGHRARRPLELDEPCVDRIDVHALAKLVDDPPEGRDLANDRSPLLGHLEEVGTAVGCSARARRAPLDEARDVAGDRRRWDAEARGQLGRRGR